MNRADKPTLGQQGHCSATAYPASTRALSFKLSAASLMVSAALGLTAPSVLAESVYISDKLTVPLRSGPTTGHRIIHQGLPAGTQMEILARDEKGVFAEIRTVRGTQGWIRSQYLTKNPIARDRLKTAQNQIDKLNKALETQKQALDTTSKQNSASSATNSELSQQLTKATEDLENLEKISKNAVSEHAENQRLNELNSRLRDEMESLTEQRDQLRSNVQQRWLMIGGGLVLLGLLLGVILKSRPRRSAWS